MSVRYVAFGAAGRAFNGCREGQFDECGVVVGEHHFAKSSVDGRRCDSDGIVGHSKVKQDARLLKDEMSTGTLRAVGVVFRPRHSRFLG